MASVYRAYEPALDRYVALKVLPREFLHDPSFAQRFRQEAQVVARLEHPNIVPIYAYDIDEAEGIPWMAMRLITAGSLAELIRRERLAARARGRDPARRGRRARLRPRQGDRAPRREAAERAARRGGRVYLADFGIAKILESSGGLTATGMITGTPQYMAPEQATGTKIGPAADVYALGIVAYEMFTGRVPFSADTPVAVLMKHVQEPLPLPGARTRCRRRCCGALLRSTAKKPEDRWPTAGAFVAALEAGLGSRTRRGSARSPPSPCPVAAAPTVVSGATGGAPRPRAPRATAVVQPRPLGSPPPPAPAAPPALAAPARRGGLGTGVLVGLGVAAVLVLAGAVGVASLLLRGPRRRRPAHAGRRGDALAEPRRSSRRAAGKTGPRARRHGHAVARRLLRSLLAARPARPSRSGGGGRARPDTGAHAAPNACAHARSPPAAARPPTPAVDPESRASPPPSPTRTPPPAAAPRRIWPRAARSPRLRCRR